MRKKIIPYQKINKERESEGERMKRKLENTGEKMTDQLGEFHLAFKNVVKSKYVVFLLRV